MSEQEQHAERREALTQVAPQSIARAHEVHDVNLRAIALFALALLVVIFIVIFSLRWLVGAWGGENLTPRPQIPPALVTAPAAPGPGIEAVPAAERKRVVAPAEMRLHSYGWIDQEAGTVHIPIERAMELVVSEGLPARATDVPNFDLPPAYRLDSNGGQEVESP